MPDFHKPHLTRREDAVLAYRVHPDLPAVLRIVKRKACMTDAANSRDPYLAEHVRDALAEDPRTTGLEVDIAAEDGVISLRGTVLTDKRRDAADAVLAERFPFCAVQNELTTRDLHEPTGAEHFG
jgi:hypothetical protein